MSSIFDLKIYKGQAEVSGFVRMLAREEGYELNVHIESRAEFECFNIKCNCRLDRLINNRCQVRRLSSFLSPKVMQFPNVVVPGILRLLSDSFGP